MELIRIAIAGCAGMRRVGKYEVGRTIGEGTFAKVKFAMHADTGQCFAFKVLNKDTVLRSKMVEQVRSADFFPPFPSVIAASLTGIG